MRPQKRFFMVMIAIFASIGFIGLAVLLHTTSKLNRIDNLIRQARENALQFDYDAAIAAMNIAIELDPDNSQLYRQRGDMIMLIYEWDRALNDYNRSIALDPHNANAYFSRGIFWYTQIDREKAKQDFEQYLSLAPEGDHADAVKDYIQTIESEIKALGE